MDTSLKLTLASSTVKERERGVCMIGYLIRIVTKGSTHLIANYSNIVCF